MTSNSFAMGTNAIAHGPYDHYDQVLVDIAAYVFRYWIDESSEAWQRARIALFDALSRVLETLKQSPEARNIIGPVIPDTKVPGGFLLPGTDHELDPLKGAFDLGLLIRYLDNNEAFPGADWGHPLDNIGAILSVADWCSRESRDCRQQAYTMNAVLRAIIMAYEIQGCLQARNAFHLLGLDHTFLVKVASTAVVSWLLGSTEAQTIAALSHAFMDGAPLRVFRHFSNNVPRKGWASGDACMRAVHLAMLTNRGQPGIPTVLSDPCCGFYKTLLYGNRIRVPQPYQSWVMENVFLKIHTVDAHGASAIEAAETVGHQLRARGFSAERDIAYIRVRTQQAAMFLNKQGPLHNSADRDHCMQYMIAVVLLKGAMIEIGDYQDKSPWAQDRRVEALRKRIELVEDMQFSLDYDDSEKRSLSSALKVILKDGTDLDEVLVEYPAGHPSREDTLDLVMSKFEKNLLAWYSDRDLTDEILKFAGQDEDDFRNTCVCDFIDAWRPE